MKIMYILLFFILFNSCYSQEKTIDIDAIANPLKDRVPTQIGEYVVKVFEDSNGVLWFGTLSKGVAQYDGKQLVYFTTADGLPSNRVVDIIEDQDGNIWFGTGNGLSKYNGKAFENFSENEGLCSNMISVLLLDHQGMLWIGTWNGMCLFDGNRFVDFELPTPKVDAIINEDTKNWVTCMLQDSEGTVWIGRDGLGLCGYDGNTFSFLTKKEGLNSNNVQAVELDDEGIMWIGTRVAEKDNSDVEKRQGRGGVNRYDGMRVTHFPSLKGLHESDVYAIYNDNAGNLWISTTHNGIYKYDGQKFNHYSHKNATMSFVKAKNGLIWLGCAGGLFHLKNQQINNVTIEGPWY